MFTIKLYTDGGRQKILAADSFTILRDETDCAQITLHRANGEDVRYDVVDIRDDQKFDPREFHRAIIENAAGRTTEIIDPARKPARTPSPDDKAKAAMAHG